MKFEDMNAMQRRLHNAACVLDGDGDEYGFVGMLREAIDDIERMRADAARYRELRRGQHWSVIDGIGDTLRADGLDAAIDSALKTQNA